MQEQELVIEGLDNLEAEIGEICSGLEHTQVSGEVGGRTLQVSEEDEVPLEAPKPSTAVAPPSEASSSSAAKKEPQAASPVGGRVPVQPTLDVPTKENYQDLGRKMIDEFLLEADAHPSNGWQFIKTQDEVTIHRKNSLSGSVINMLRGQTVINMGAEKVFQRLVDSEHLKYVDSYYMLSKICETYDPEHAIVYYQYKFPFPLYPRDFICLEVYKKINDTTWLAITRSVAASHVPENPAAFVRGNLRVSGYRIQSVPDNDNACIVTSLCECDPGGSVPKWLINREVDQPLVLARIKLLLEKGVKSYNK
jgi:hypothetical protein